MSRLSRRDFLGTSAAVAAGLAAAQTPAAAQNPVSAHDKLVVALIGCGGQGRGDLHAFMRLPEVEVAAVCDVDDTHIAAAARDVERAGKAAHRLRTSHDFRHILDQKDIDAVIIGTPDHWHAYVLIAACAAGKDVYCEKPLSHNIVEGRAMVEAARRNKRVVQVGTQQRSGRHFQEAVQYVRSGQLGDILLCRTWITNGSRKDATGNPPDEAHAPPGVDYDLWLGPAPLRPFNRNRFHGNFRWFWDYGNGLCNDWGVHLNDIVLWAMGVQAPLSVFAPGGKYDIADNSDTPDTLDVHYQYPNFLHFYTVRRGHYHYGSPDRSHGMEFQGTKGVLTLDRGGWVVTADRDRPQPERHGGSEQHQAHVKNFVHCVRNRSETPASEIEAMHRATTACHLANIAYRLGRRIAWDAHAERCYRGYDADKKEFVGEDAEANAYLFREPRKPWSLSG
jgi:predicted dehydrogenase